MKEVKDEVKEIEMEEEYAVIGIPKHTLELSIEVKVWIDGKVQTASKTLDLDEVQDALRKAREGYIDDDDLFVLTEKGRLGLEGVKQLYDE